MLTDGVKAEIDDDLSGVLRDIRDEARELAETLMWRASPAVAIKIPKSRDNIMLAREFGEDMEISLFWTDAS
ncbi:MAG: hypothetical protein F4X57_03090 [Chloroflexi bacterium]|nr:hypothetical protein [Chloroflexota bacterium]